MRRAVQSLQRALDRPPHGHAQPAQPVGEFGREKFIGGVHGITNYELRISDVELARLYSSFGICNSKFQYCGSFTVSMIFLTI
jgi:hypothetical protein